jgi:lipoprotein signal peptidase
MAEPTPYWFPAKRYGWGWGLPRTWQGWVVLLAFALLLLLGFVLFPPTQDVVPFIVYVAVLSAALFGICYVKGEPPAWRWGGK